MSSAVEISICGKILYMDRLVLFKKNFAKFLCQYILCMCTCMSVPEQLLNKIRKPLWYKLIRSAKTIGFQSLISVHYIESQIKSQLKASSGKNIPFCVCPISLCNFNSSQILLSSLSKAGYCRLKYHTKDMISLALQQRRKISGYLTS